MYTRTVRDGAQMASYIFQVLTGNRISEKYKVRDLVSEPNHGVDLAVLRTLLTKAICEDFAFVKDDGAEDYKTRDVRSWLVGILARISSDDESATKLVVQYTNIDFEPFNWIRYWALEGLIFSGNAVVEKVTREVENHSNDPLLSMLASAWRASKGDRTALQRIKAALANPEMSWFALRALRVVPLEKTVPTLCEIALRDEYTDITYDAIVALGMVPGGWNHSNAAAQALSNVIITARGTPWKDGMRIGAIIGLGNLKIESSGPLLIEEMGDNNPGIVRDAALAIERILGLGAAVSRVVEAAAKTDESGFVAFGRALRWLNREAVAEELESLMGIGSAYQQETARALLSDLGGAVAFQKLRARTDVIKQYSDVLEKSEEKIRELFENSVREAQNGFHLALIMDTVVFGVGIVLVVVSAGLAMFNHDFNNWASGVTGGTGVLGIVYSVLIANPRRQIRESVDHLMRLKMIFLSFLRRLHQTDQAYARRMLDDAPITAIEVKGFSDQVGEIMAQTLHSGQNKKTE
jgi:hypothetical protein